jgi:hypothetical protein
LTTIHEKEARVRGGGNRKIQKSTNKHHTLNLNVLSDSLLLITYNEEEDKEEDKEDKEEDGEDEKKKRIIIE